MSDSSMLTVCLGLALLAAPSRQVRAQAIGDTTQSDRRGWALLRVGPAWTTVPDSRGHNARFGSLSGGIAGSFGPVVGMVRMTGNANFGFSDSPSPTTTDLAVLAGLRSAGDRLFITGAAGPARAVISGEGTNPSASDSQLALAYDLSAHAAYQFAGVALSLAGVVGPGQTSYVVLSFGAELGWFGR